MLWSFEEPVIPPEFYTIASDRGDDARMVATQALVAILESIQNNPVSAYMYPTTSRTWMLLTEALAALQSKSVIDVRQQFQRVA